MKYGLTAFCKMSVIIGWVAIGILYWKIIQYLLNIINPSNTFRNKINVLLEEYPNIDIVAMGFPENWKEQPLWKSWTIKRVIFPCLSCKEQGFVHIILTFVNETAMMVPRNKKKQFEIVRKLRTISNCSATCGTFDALLVQTIDATLGLRCTMLGYQYSKILRSLMCVYLCSGKERIYDDMNETSKMD